LSVKGVGHRTGVRNWLRPVKGCCFQGGKKGGKEAGQRRKPIAYRKAARVKLGMGGRQCDSPGDMRGKQGNKKKLPKA